MTTQISPMLAVRDGRAAIAFYQQAFGATLLWELEGAVAGLSIDGAEFPGRRIPRVRHAKPSGVHYGQN